MATSNEELRELLLNTSPARFARAMDALKQRDPEAHKKLVRVYRQEKVRLERATDMLHTFLSVFNA